MTALKYEGTKATEKSFLSQSNLLIKIWLIQYSGNPPGRLILKMCTLGLWFDYYFQPLLTKLVSLALVLILKDQKECQHLQPLKNNSRKISGDYAI